MDVAAVSKPDTKSALMGTAWTLTQTQSLFNRQKEWILQEHWHLSSAQGLAWSLLFNKEQPLSEMLHKLSNKPWEHTPGLYLLGTQSPCLLHSHVRLDLLELPWAVSWNASQIIAALFPDFSANNSRHPISSSTLPLSGCGIQLGHMSQRLCKADEGHKPFQNRQERSWVRSWLQEKDLRTALVVTIL